jgi:quercetin dioxygenase-like cupin family protein
MKTLDPLSAARNAIAANKDRPATAVIHDTDDVRLVVFRIEPGQSVPMHRSTSSVLLTVLEGAGVLCGESEGETYERAYRAGESVAYDPQELHGMRSYEKQMLLLATIAPRPGAR